MNVRKINTSNNEESLKVNVTDKDLKNELDYYIADKIITDMFLLGLISLIEYEQIRRKNIEKFSVKLRIKEMHEFIDSERIELKEYDKNLVRKLIEKIVVYDEYFQICFKSGIKINISK